MDVLQPLGIATLDLMKGVQDDVELGETMGDCRWPQTVNFLTPFSSFISIRVANTSPPIYSLFICASLRHGRTDRVVGYDDKVLQEVEVSEKDLHHN